MQSMQVRLSAASMRGALAMEAMLALAATFAAI